MKIKLSLTGCRDLLDPAAKQIKRIREILAAAGGNMTPDELQKIKNKAQLVRSLLRGIDELADLAIFEALRDPYKALKTPEDPATAPAGYYAFIKRLGIKHYAKGSEARTICGRPMLGNNYARESLQAEIVGPVEICRECQDIINKQKDGAK